ncbi:hypothetical protein [Komagataeibacter europaeus]|uniref:hypothetical protein n=1 Tax=Komagataeibacter europaeus TaxID=33995 RepID=UPI0015F9D836|nr:hypothetical protein [Komagataeibacter europaeus]
MFKTYFARSILAAFGNLLNFGAPVRPYNVSTADEINRSAWEATGKSMRAAMRQVDGEIHSDGRFVTNH